MLTRPIEVGASALILILLLVYFVKRSDGPGRPPQAQARATSEGHAPKVEPPQAVLTDGSSSSFAATLSRCLVTQRSDSLDDWAAQQERQADQVELELVNLHVRESDGTEHRLQILPHAETAQVSEFEVDREGLPIPGRKQVVTVAQVDSLKTEFLHRGELIYEQRKVKMHKGQAKSAMAESGEVEWVNGHVHELMVYHEGVGFFCRDSNCECHRP